MTPSRLASMSASELSDFFRGTDAVTVTDMFRELSDHDLGRMLDSPDFREPAVEVLLLRFPEFADPERLAAVDGVVCFDLVARGGAAERHTVRIGDGTVTALDPHTPADVTIAAGMVEFVRLVTGQANAALLYLGEQLSVHGDAMLALEVGSVFTVPGTTRAAVDPSALDPEDVATAIHGTSTRHLREVMSGGFRDVVLGEVFRRFPDFVDQEKASGTKLDVGFKIGGRSDGGADRFLVHLDHGRCSVEHDPPSARGDATLVLDGVAFMRLITGQLHPVKGVLTGGMKVSGDRAKALAFNSVMLPPRPRR